MAKTLFGTVQVEVFPDGSVRGTIGMNHTDFELAGTSKKPTYRFLVYRGGVSDNPDGGVIETDEETSIIGHVDDENFPSNNDFEIHGQARTHHPGNILFPKKYRPLDEIAELTIPKIEPQDPTPTEWLIPILHQQM